MPRPFQFIMYHSGLRTVASPSPSHVCLTGLPAGAPCADHHAACTQAPRLPPVVPQAVDAAKIDHGAAQGRTGCGEPHRCEGGTNPISGPAVPATECTAISALRPVARSPRTPGQRVEFPADECCFCRDEKVGRYVSIPGRDVVTQDDNPPRRGSGDCARRILSG